MTTFTIPEVAARLRVHPDTVRDLIRSGELPAFNASVKPNSMKPRYRVTPEALAGFEARRSVSTNEKPAARRPRREPFKRYV